MKKWILKCKSHPNGNFFTEKYGIQDEIAQIMLNRNVANENLEMYLSPKLEFLRNPYLLKDMEKAVDRINHAIDNKEKIFIYGDYDVDGVSSTSILMIFFDNIGYENINYYIPNRLEEGYGLNIDAIDYINEEGANLIITVDCGITSINEVDYAKKLGIDVIITDHHECQEYLPNAIAVVDPKRHDCDYPFKGICGCGVALKLIHALSGASFFDDINKYLEITSLATICDIMPVLDENRIIVKNGLDIIGNGSNIGMKSLIDVCGLTNARIKSSHIGFSLGPRINASGRLGFSNLGVELFTSTSTEHADKIAQLMNANNEERQLIESNIYKEAELLMEELDIYNDKVIVLASKGWHHGIIGIVASKLTEKYYKPCVLLCIEDNVAVGSARSIKGFDIFSALMECKEYMLKFGGHEQAAGLTVSVENIDELRKRLNDIADYSLDECDLIEEIKIEYEIDETKINLDLVDNLHALEPFGIKNPTPYFLLRDCLVKNIYLLGQSKNHLKINISKEYDFECIGFGLSYLKEKFDVGDKIDIVFQIDKNTFNGNTNIQLLIKDIRLSKTTNIHKHTSILEPYAKNIIDYCDKVIEKYNENIFKNDTTDKMHSLNMENNIEKNIKYTNLFDEKNNLNYSNIDKNNISLKEITKKIVNRCIDRVENIIELLEDKDLIVFNTLNGYYRALSDVNISDCEKLDFIFLSNIDKTEIKRYNKIIMYDYPNDYSEIEHIYSNKNCDSKVILNFNESDFVHLLRTYNDRIFDREKFVKVYKYFSSIDSGVLVLSEVIDEIEISVSNMLFILKVLENEKLIKFDIDLSDNEIAFSMLPKPEKKLNLQENIIVKMLEFNLQNFKKTYEI